MDEPLTHERFLPYVSQQFGLEGHHLMLLLRSVDPHPRFAAPRAQRVPFTLIFDGPVDDVLPAGDYRAAAPDGPVFELHIMPIHTHSRDRQEYQVVFN